MGKKRVTCLYMIGCNSWADVISIKCRLYEILCCVYCFATSSNFSIKLCILWLLCLWLRKAIAFWKHLNNCCKQCKETKYCVFVWSIFVRRLKKENRVKTGMEKLKPDWRKKFWALEIANKSPKPFQFEKHDILFFHHFESFWFENYMLIFFCGLKINSNF